MIKYGEIRQNDKLLKISAEELSKTVVTLYFDSALYTLF